MRTSLTIINTSAFRGVLAPAAHMPKKLLEDIIDFIELSSPASARGTKRRIREADKARSWVPMKLVHREARR